MLSHEVSRRLELKLGLGEFPMVRRRLFARLQRVCEQRGDGALLIVAGVLEEALGPQIRDKGKYFGWVVVRRLTEQGFWAPSEPPVNQVRSQAEALANAKASVGRPVEDPATTSATAELVRLRMSNELLRREVEERRQADVKARLVQRARDAEGKS